MPKNIEVDKGDDSGDNDKMVTKSPLFKKLNIIIRHLTSLRPKKKLCFF